MLAVIWSEKGEEKNRRKRINIFQLRYSGNVGDSDDIDCELDKVLELLTMVNAHTMDMMPVID
jgi:hypothetical protein